MTQLFCEKKAKAKKKEKPADTADVDPMDPGKKPDADKLSDAKANAWTKVIAYRDAKEFAVWQEKAKLDIFVLVYRQLLYEGAVSKRVRIRTALTIPHGSNWIRWTCHSSSRIVQAVTCGPRISFLEK